VSKNKRHFVTAVACRLPMVQYSICAEVFLHACRGNLRMVGLTGSGPLLQIDANGRRWRWNRFTALR
jgi:hypothetical protein